MVLSKDCQKLVKTKGIRPFARADAFAPVTRETKDEKI
jgi:hypothetical protein